MKFFSSKYSIRLLVNCCLLFGRIQIATVNWIVLHCLWQCLVFVPFDIMCRKPWKSVISFPSKSFILKRNVFKFTIHVPHKVQGRNHTIIVVWIDVILVGILPYSFISAFLSLTSLFPVLFLLFCPLYPVSSSFWPCRIQNSKHSWTLSFSDPQFTSMNNSKEVVEVCARLRCIGKVWPIMDCSQISLSIHLFQLERKPIFAK